MTQQTIEMVGKAGSGSLGALRQWRPSEFSWVWLAKVALFAISALLAPGSVRINAILSILPFVAMLAIVAIGQTIVIRQRGLDMSASGLMTLGGMLVATIGYSTGSMVLACLATIAISALLGDFNGALIARLGIMPIVATLATNAIFVGAVRTLSGGSPIAVPPSLAAFSHETLLGVPNTLLLSLIFIVTISFVTQNTVTGRRYVAVGANPAAAAAAGIAVLRYQIGSYVVAAICFAVAGILYAGFIGNASQTVGETYLLPGIAAVVVGGTSFAGGRGSVVASSVAALFMVQLGQMVLALGADAAVQLLVQAAALVLATVIRYIPGWIAPVRLFKRGLA